MTIAPAGRPREMRLFSILFVVAMATSGLYQQKAEKLAESPQIQQAMEGLRGLLMGNGFCTIQTSSRPSFFAHRIDSIIRI